MISVSRCDLIAIASMRTLFLKEMNAQFIHDKCHLYDWSDDYVFMIDGSVAGYGCVWGIDQRQDRDTIFEFYVMPNFRTQQINLMWEFIRTSGVTTLECQTNDPNTSKLFFENAIDIKVQSVLFSDQGSTNRTLGNIQLMDRSEADQLHHERKLELLQEDKVVATGGLLLNYNFPYADIYVDVPEAFRGKGFGALIVQEAKKLAYRIGRVPAARCRLNNQASKYVLIAAGFQPCGYWLVGKTAFGASR